MALGLFSENHEKETEKLLGKSHAENCDLSEMNF